ncbi:uncharacterized protein JCM6883_001304 [Sporobolomyces salmoneus]|uniref:uncharacterized protein n=1 Tax=Sporobolomyces salmoneus TaxID=183962 RepID=UPI00317F75A7
MTTQPPSELNLTASGSDVPSSGIHNAMQTPGYQPTPINSVAQTQSQHAQNLPRVPPLPWNAIPPPRVHPQTYPTGHVSTLRDDFVPSSDGFPSFNNQHPNPLNSSVLVNAHDYPSHASLHYYPSQNSSYDYALPDISDPSYYSHLSELEPTAGNLPHDPYSTPHWYNPNSGHFQFSLYLLCNLDDPHLSR